jgi:cytochrome c-type biogenesis protein CcmF
MIPEFGQLCLVAAMMLSLLQGGTPVLQWLAGSHRIMGLTRPLATLAFLCVARAFAMLIYSYAISDFSVLNVVENSHTDKPMLFKIVGSWGNHEGSMLLWMLVLATGGFAVAFLRTEDNGLQTATLATLGVISAGFLAFIIFTSNPFLRVWPIPVNGEDLNPILQDIGLALHPPTLYVGYVGFGIVFAYAIAGLLRGELNQAWAKQVQPWILFPWSALTLGIGAGSWWAYRELGWGGWWFWDPVENVSLLPWLSGTALLHANLALERRGQLARWVALLAILTFSLSLIGTFIVRSGLITSVHAFATDPARGMFILGYIIVVTGLALAIYTRSRFTAPVTVNLLSRTGLIVIGNLLLISATATVLLAILYPLVLELMGAPSVSVGPHYFNTTFLPLTAPLLLLAGIAPLLGWDRAKRSQLISHGKALAPAFLVAGMLALALAKPHYALGFAGLALTCWLAWGVLRYTHRLLRAKAFSMRGLAMVLAHLGIAVFALGITLTALFKQTYEAPLQPKESLQFGAFTLRLEQVVQKQEYNYTLRRARFQVEEHGRVITHLAPELRDYQVRRMQTTEAALYSTPWRDIYLVLGSNGDESGFGVRIYVTPGQQLIWAGFILTAVGGFCSLAALLRQRLRKGQL